MILPVFQKEIEINRQMLNQSIRFATVVDTKTYTIYLNLTFKEDGGINNMSITAGNGKSFIFDSYHSKSGLEQWTIVNMLIQKAIEYVKEASVSEVMVTNLKWNYIIHI